METSSNWEEFLSYLLDRDKDGYILNLRDSTDDSLFHRAVSLRAYSVFEDLIDRGINLFHYAIKKGKKPVVNMMLRSQKIGTILNKIDPVTGCAPLYEAVMSSNIEIVEVLMAAGADIHQTNINGDKLFEVAVEEEIRYVLQHYKNGYDTLLWEALNKGTEMDIYNLLCRKLDLMFSNEKGECFFNQMVQKVSADFLAFVLGTCEYSFNVKDKTTGKSARQYLEELGEEKRLGIMKKYL